jgi:lysyl-tRNA synthetase class II
MQKREKLQELNDAYPVSVPTTHTIAQVRKDFPDLEIDVATGKKVAVAGRVVFANGTILDRMTRIQTSMLAKGAYTVEVVSENGNVNRQNFIK